MNQDRITTELVRDARGMRVKVSIDGIQVGEVRPIYGWAPDLLDALDEGILKMNDFYQLSEGKGSIRAIENELRRRIGARASAGPLFEQSADSPAAGATFSIGGLRE